ncbi:MAG: hypothetical protein ACJ79N_12960 [Gemmatimonadaceae bacterium]
MNATRRLAACGALLFAIVPNLHAQVVERPVSFDSAGRVVVITPYIAERAALRAPWWPVAGEFREARLYTVTDSTYVLAVARPSGVVERYTLSAADRDAIRAIVSRLPREVIAARTDARNSFVRNQSLLGIFVYGPAFAGAIADNDASQVAGYLVVAGGTFFAASEISRRFVISRPQSDLAFNMGHNIALAGLATMYLFSADDRAQSAGALVGGLAGTGLGLRFARNMTEADAVGTGFGSDLAALIGLGVSTAMRGDRVCPLDFGGSVCRDDRTQVGVTLASGLIGYPLGLLYPRNARYSVTPGDINTLWSGVLVGGLTGIAFLPESPRRRAVATVITAGGVLGVIAADRFLVQRADHGRTEATQLLLGTAAGALMGGGAVALFTNAHQHPQQIFVGSAIGSLAGMIATEHYIRPSPDAGPPRVRLTLNRGSIFLIASRTPGNHSLLNVRF